MKKSIGFLLFLFIAKAAIGQIDIGVNAGGNLCKINQTIDYGNNQDIVPGDQDLKLTLGFGFGIPVEIGITEKFTLYSGLNYLQKGSAVKYEIPEFENEIVRYEGFTKYNYCEIPLQVRYYFISKKVKVHGSLGPSFGYMLNAVTKYDLTIINTMDNSTEVQEQNEKFSSKEVDDAGISRFDISMTVGTGIDYELWKGRLFLQVNYLFGLSDMAKDNELGIDDITQYNRGLYTSIGYFISLGRRRE